MIPRRAPALFGFTRCTRVIRSNTSSERERTKRRDEVPDRNFAHLKTQPPRIKFEEPHELKSLQPATMITTGRFLETALTSSAIREGAERPKFRFRLEDHPLMRPPSLLFLILFLGAAKLFAHETWLSPSSFVDSTRGAIRFDLTSGMEFPELDYAISPDRIAEAQARVEGAKLDLKITGRDQHSLPFQLTSPPAGLVTAWIRLLPKTLQLSPEKVAEYFAEIDAPSTVRDTWKEWKRFGPWKETYTKCAKTFLRVGDGANDESWKTAAGLPLEIIPLVDPTRLKVGDKADFQLIENGEPLPEISVGLITEGKGKRIFVTTDKVGHATFAFDKPGRALLFAVHLHPRPGHEWQSNFSTVTLQIASRPVTNGSVVLP